MEKKIEVERKRRLPDGGEGLVRVLEAAGWYAAGPVTETDVYYSRPDVDYMETVECLRVRSRGDFAEITYKPSTTGLTHSSDDVISKEETNVALADVGQALSANRLMESIGMRRLARVKKNRTVFRHPDQPAVVVAIDVVAGVGTFVETEVIGLEAAVAAKLVERTETALGVSDHPTVDLPYRDLVLAAAAEAGVAS
ncbi:class IV adenylate cyclase [Streptomyces griseocarneus]|nr:class IV adenylate cyclase [Streptomyces griseocarneus]